VVGLAPTQKIPSPDTPFGDGDIAARCPYPTVGTTRRVVPARSAAQGGTNVVGYTPNQKIPSPDTPFGDGDDSASRPYQESFPAATHLKSGGRGLTFTFMDWDDLLREILHEAHVRLIADDTGVSTSYIYKWAEEGEQHRGNPIFYTACVLRHTQNPKLRNALAAVNNGHFTPNPPPRRLSRQEMKALALALLADDARLMQRLANLANSAHPTDAEWDAFEQEWERVKGEIESFKEMRRKPKAPVKKPKRLLAWLLGSVPLLDWAEVGMMVG